ncbi:hypothetical protein UlMin_010351, partial [Ulmus minor]
PSAAQVCIGITKSLKNYKEEIKRLERTLMGSSTSKEFRAAEKLVVDKANALHSSPSPNPRSNSVQPVAKKVVSERVQSFCNPNPNHPGRYNHFAISNHNYPSSEDLRMKQAETSQSLNNAQLADQNQTTNPVGNRIQVPFGLVLPVLMKQLHKDKRMQLQELLSKLKGGQISKQQYIHLTRGVVGEQELKLAAKKLLVQSKASARQQPSGMPSVSNPHSFTQFHHKGASSSADVSHIPSSTAQVKTDPNHQIIPKNVQILRKADCQLNSHGMQASQMTSTNQKQQYQQQLQFPQTSFNTYGGNSGNYHLYSGTNVDASAISLKLQDSQMRPISQHHSMGSTLLRRETQGVNILNVPKLERQNSIGGHNRMPGGSLSHFANKPTMQHIPVPRQSSAIKEQNAGTLLPMSCVKPEPIDQASELQPKTTSSNSQGLPSLSAMQIEQGNARSGTAKDESLVNQPPRIGFSTSKSGVSSLSTIMAPSNSVSSSITMQLDNNVPLGPGVPCGISSAGTNNKTPLKKAALGQKKPLEAIGSSTLPSSKKQKVSGNILDQSIEQLDDVTSVSRVNLKEENKKLFSVPKEDSRVSEASRKVVQEEERLILQNIPLQKKLAVIKRCFSKELRAAERLVIDKIASTSIVLSIENQIMLWHFRLDTPQQNGIDERKNRYILEEARSIMFTMGNGAPQPKRATALQHPPSKAFQSESVDELSKWQIESAQSPNNGARNSQVNQDSIYPKGKSHKNNRTISKTTKILSKSKYSKIHPYRIDQPEGQSYQKHQQKSKQK